MKMNGEDLSVLKEKKTKKTLLKIIKKNIMMNHLRSLL